MSWEISEEELEQISREINEDMKKHPRKYATVALKQEHIPSLYLLLASIKSGTSLLPKRDHARVVFHNIAQDTMRTACKPRKLGKKLSRILGVPEERVSNPKFWLPAIMEQFPHCFRYTIHKIRDLYTIRSLAFQPGEVEDKIFALLEPEIVAGAAFGAASIATAVLNEELRQTTKHYFDVVSIMKEFDLVAEQLEKIPSDPVIDWYKSVFNVYTIWMQTSSFRKVFLDEPSVPPHLEWTRFHALVSIPNTIYNFIRYVVLEPREEGFYGPLYDTLRHEFKDAVNLGIKPVENIERMFPEPPEDVVQRLRSLSAV